jgi:hypothetical protein
MPCRATSLSHPMLERPISSAFFWAAVSIDVADCHPVLANSVAIWVATFRLPSPPPPRDKNNVGGIDVHGLK